MKTATRSLKVSLVLVSALVFASGARSQTNRPISAEPLTTIVNGGDALLVNSNKANGTYKTTQIAFSNLVASSMSQAVPLAVPLAVPSALSNANAGLLAGPVNTLTNFASGKNFDMPLTTAENAAWAAIHAQQFQDATNLVETWQDMSQWTNSGSNLIIQNGALRAIGVLSPSGLNHSFPIGTNDEARIVFSMTIPAPGSLSGNGLAFVGVSTDAPGAGVPNNGNSILGIGVSHNATISQALLFNQLTQTLDTTNQMPGGTYTGFILIDTNYVCLSLTYQGGTNHYYARVARSALGNIGNVSLWIGDTMGTNGITVNWLAARLAHETSMVRGGIEGNAECIQWTTDDAGQNILVWTPPQYDSRVPLPLLIMCHGSGGDEQFPWVGQNSQGSPQRGFYQQLVTNGWIVASSFQHGDNWGNANSVQDITGLLRWVRRHYAISSVWLNGASMGGASSLNWIQRHQGEAAGYIGLFPVTSLTNMFQGGGSFSNSIVTAFGLALNGSDYATKTAGYDPLIAAANRYWRVPNIWYYDPADPIVNASSNTLAFQTWINGLSSESTLVSVPGAGHGGAALYQAANVLAWRNRVSDQGPTNRPPSGVSPVYQSLRVISPLVGNFTGNGAALTNIPISGLAIPPVTNAQAGINFLRSTAGPAISQGANLLILTGDSLGVAINPQNNVGTLFNFDANGAFFMNGVSNKIYGDGSKLTNVSLTGATGSAGLTNSYSLDVTFGGQTAIAMAASSSVKWMSVGIGQSTTSASRTRPTWRTPHAGSITNMFIENGTGMDVGTNTWAFVATNGVVSPYFVSLTNATLGTFCAASNTIGGGLGQGVATMFVGADVEVNLVISNNCSLAPANQVLTGHFLFRNGQ